MLSIEELTNSFKAILYDRLTSPFAGAVITSWTFFNWKSLYYLIYDKGSVISKLAHIEAHYSDIRINLYYPLASALIISIAYPLISYIPFFCQEYASSFKRKIKEKLITDKLLTHEESVRLSRKIAEVTKLNEQILREKTDIETKLENDLANTQAQHLKNEADLKNTLTEKHDKLVGLEKQFDDSQTKHEKGLSGLIEKYEIKIRNIGKSNLAEINKLSDVLKIKDKDIKRFSQYSGKSGLGFDNILKILEEHKPIVPRLGEGLAAHAASKGLTNPKFSVGFTEYKEMVEEIRSCIPGKLE